MIDHLKGIKVVELGTYVAVPKAARSVGADNAAVFTALGYAPEAIAGFTK